MLVLLHRKPFHPWTLAEIAQEVGGSRSVVAETVHAVPGRASLLSGALAIAARGETVADDAQPVLQLASDVGYEAEAAFNRAFKREFGLPTAQYRKRGREQRRGRAVEGGSSRGAP